MQYDSSVRDEIQRARALLHTLSAIRDAQPQMRARYGPNRCVIATRIAVEVLRGRGFKAVPTPVSVLVHPEGADEATVFGFHDGTVPAGQWNGHLVCIAEGDLLLDLTLDQINDHVPDARLAPYLGPAPAGFARGGEFETQVGNCAVRYAAVPDGRAFLQLEDWEDEPERRPMVDVILTACGLPLQEAD